MNEADAARERIQVRERNERRRLRAARTVRAVGPDGTREQIAALLVDDDLSQDRDELALVLSLALELQRDPAVVGRRIDPEAYMLDQQTTERPPEQSEPSDHGAVRTAPAEKPALAPIPRARFNEVREKLRTMREDDPKLKPADARAALELIFGGTLSATSFTKTFWQKSKPERKRRVTRAEPEETEEAEEIEIEPDVLEEEAITAELQLLVDENGLRVVFDKVLPAEQAYSLVSTIAYELRGRQMEELTMPGFEGARAHVFAANG